MLSRPSGVVRPLAVEEADHRRSKVAVGEVPCRRWMKGKFTKAENGLARWKDDEACSLDPERNGVQAGSRALAQTGEDEVEVVGR